MIRYSKNILPPRFWQAHHSIDRDFCSPVMVGAEHLADSTVVITGVPIAATIKALFLVPNFRLLLLPLY